MKKALLILSALLISLLSNAQSHLHSGKNNASVPLFDSGGVTLGVKEYNFDSCGVTGRQIYLCDFTFKNNNSYSVILKRYDFYTENATDPVNKVGCAIARVSISKNNDTLKAKSSKKISICGETTGAYKKSGTLANTGCVYHWKFTGFMPYKK